jgi:DNA-binding NarL/FixJ family response regulator
MKANQSKTLAQTWSDAWAPQKPESVSAKLPKQQPIPGEAFGLTPRQAAVMTLVHRGLKNSAIASDLAMSSKTVAAHVSIILIKLGADSRGLAMLVWERHLGKRPRNNFQGHKSCERATM